jgi:hypothetical protein
MLFTVTGFPIGILSKEALPQNLFGMYLGSKESTAPASITPFNLMGTPG